MWRKDFGLFFLVISNMTNVREHFIMSTKYFDNYGANDMNIYLAPKRSFETNIWKDSCFHDETSFWPILPCNIERDKPQGTIYNGPQAIVATALEIDTAFS